MAAMALTVFVVSKRPVSPLVTATARAAVVAFPIVLLTAIVFAFRNGDDPLGPSPAAAAAVTGFMLLALSTVDAVWSELRSWSRDAVQAGLRSAGYLVLGLAGVLTMSWLSVPTWIGPVILGYALVVWIVDQRIGGTGDWFSSAARLMAVGGALVSLPFIGPTISVLSALSIVAALWLVDGPIREPIRRFVEGAVDDDDVTKVAAWSLMALGVLGFFRLEYPLGGLLLAATALLSVSTQWLRSRARRLCVWSGYPALMLAVITLAYAVVHLPGVATNSVVVAILFGASAVAALSVVPWPLRG
jgi:hypothetical protein